MSCGVGTETEVSGLSHYTSLCYRITDEKAPPPEATLEKRPAEPNVVLAVALSCYDVSCLYLYHFAHATW